MNVQQFKIPSSGKYTQGVRISTKKQLQRSMQYIKASRSMAAAKIDQQFQNQKNQEMMEFLQKDLVHLFDDQGIDSSRYEDKVYFMDPLNSFNDITSYVNNIQFLRKALDAQYELLQMKPTGDNEITTRWTMSFKPVVTSKTPISKWFDPEVKVTGVSIMKYNPDTMNFISHVDYWDSVTSQEFFSFEAAADLASQLTTSFRTPDIETPKYTVLRRTREYEIRKYEPYLVAECDMAEQTEPGPANPVRPSQQSWNNLAKFIFGNNEAEKKMKMTTPVFSNVQGRMQFVVGYNDCPDASSVPSPKNSDVEVKQMPGGIYAASIFNGENSYDTFAAQQQKLVQATSKDGLKLKDTYSVARYNDPGSTKPRFRRNEVLIELDQEYDLWFNTFK